MKRIHWMVLRMLPGPFLGWLGTLMFLLIMQFLIHHLPDIAGKGLPVWVIGELLSYSLAYMLVLAVPMAILLATLMTFGQLAESNTYAVIKSSGVSFLQLVWPTLVAGLLVAAGMTYFNNIVLPEANFRAKNLWRDIHVKQPGFELRPGVFYDGLSDYSILVEDLEGASNALGDITIYDYTEGSHRTAVIKAERGHLEATDGGARIELVLEDGEVHRLLASAGAEPRYERLQFERHRLTLTLSDFNFERSELRAAYRSDRTTPTPAMRAYVDSLRAVIRAERDTLRARVLEHLTPPPPEAAQETATRIPQAAYPAGERAETTAAVPKRPVLAGLTASQQQRAYGVAMQDARAARTLVENVQRDLSWKVRRADSYQVEIYKKYSIALACLLFVLIGAPLGLLIRRGGLGAVGVLALGIFMFYWITLVQGEKLADRGFLAPWVGMWIANIVGLAAALWLFVSASLDLRATPPLRQRLWGWMRSWNRAASSGEGAARRRPERSEEVPLGCASTHADALDEKIQNPKSAI